MDYEKLLTRVGNMGRYQAFLLGLSVVASSNAGIHLFKVVFTMGMPRFRCAVPGLENDTFLLQDESHAHLVQAAIPFDADKGGYSRCSRYKTDQGQQLRGDNASSLETEACTRWVYSTEVFASSIVSQLNLVCDRQIYVSHANMIAMAGIMVIAVVSGPLSDRWGRKTLFILHNWLVLAASVAVVFVQSEIVFLALRFLEVGTCMATFMCIYGIVSEISAPSKRALGTSISMCGWSVGMLVVILVAFFVREWRTLHLILSAPLVLTGVSFPFLIPESPKWLLSRRRYKQAQAVLQTIARVNGKSLPVDLDLSAGVLECTGQRSAGFVQGLVMLFKSRILAFRLLILAIGWSVNAMVYYGVGLNLGLVIPGDIYTNFFVIAASSLVTLPLTVWILVSRGRKLFFCLCMMLGGSFCLATMFPILGSEDLSWLTTTLSFVGKLLLTTSFAIIWLYTNELLPTSARLSGVGFCNFFGRLGALVAPYIATLPTVVEGKLGQALPLIVFGFCGLVSGALCLLLPETGNRKLPDTIKEAELLKWREKVSPKAKRVPTENGVHVHTDGAESQFF